MAFTLILLIGAGLFVRTLTHLHERVGFDAGNLLMLSINPPGLGYGEADAERVMRRVSDRLRDLPVVERAAIGNAALLGFGWSTIELTIQADERRRQRSRRVAHAGRSWFLRGAGTPVLAGREFDERDVVAGESATAVADGHRQRELRAALFQGRESIGARLGLGTRPNTPTDIEIIGVVQDFSAPQPARRRSRAGVLPVLGSELR